ncbi:hypothetical protein EP227_03380 [bacterium]|nr:MAG: hypothetical protein EP227_03380 [bacterium]
MKRLFIITAFILLLAGAYAGLRGWTGTKEDLSNHERTITDPSIEDLSNNERTITDPSISELMDSMSIQQLTGEEKALDFLLRSLEGDQSRLSQYHGNVVLVSFWATW